VVALNLGLVVRITTEPLARAGHGSAWTTAALAVSALTQVGAVLMFAIQRWPRLAARKERPPAGATKPAAD
jgi:hypothetical protein